jgi:hypothetical protein
MSYVSHDDVMNFINSISGIANRIFELEESESTPVHGIRRNTPDGSISNG